MHPRNPNTREGEEGNPDSEGNEGLCLSFPSLARSQPHNLILTPSVNDPKSFLASTSDCGLRAQLLLSRKAPGLVLCSKRSCGGQKEDKHETLHKQVKESNVFKLLCSVALDHKMGGSISLNTMEQVKNLTLATWSSLFPRSCPLPHLSSSQHVLEILFLTHPLLPAHASTWMHWIWPESLVIAPTLSA